MNLILVGDNVTGIAFELHNIRQGVAIIGDIDDLKNVNLNTYLKNGKTIMISSAEFLMKYTINEVIDFCENNHMGLAFIGEDEDSEEEIMFYSLVTRFPDTSFMWFRNTENIGYDEMIERSVDILDYTIRTPS